MWCPSRLVIRRFVSQLRRRCIVAVVVVTAVAAASASAATLAAEPAVTFIAIGDLPYKADQAVELDDKIAPAIAAAGVPFVVHYGDFKAGGGACSDAVFVQARDRILVLHKGPVFYSPGDNDWTDCDRFSTGAPVSALARIIHEGSRGSNLGAVYRGAWGADFWV